MFNLNYKNCDGRACCIKSIFIMYVNKIRLMGVLEALAVTEIITPRRDVGIRPDISAGFLNLELRSKLLHIDMLIKS